MDIIFKGIQRNPNSYSLENGALLGADNVTIDNGSLRPAPIFNERWRDLDAEKVVTIHSVDNRRFAICIDRVGDLVATELFDDDSVGQIAMTICDQFYGTYGDIERVSILGHTLIFITSGGVYYAVFNDGAYRWLGRMPLGEMEATFSLHGDVRMSKADLTDIANSDNKLNVPYTAWHASDHLDLTKDFSDQGEKDRRDQAQRRLGDNVFALLNKLIGDAHADNKFVLPFFIRYAYRLFDGSHICHSAPIWMFPSNGEIPTWFDTKPKTGTDANGWKVWCWWEKGYYRSMVNACDIFADLKIPTSIEKWKDLITAVDIYISAPFYHFNQGGKINGWGYRPVTAESCPNFGSCVPERQSAFIDAVGSNYSKDNADIPWWELYAAGTYGTDDYNSSTEYGQTVYFGNFGFRMPSDFFAVEMKSDEDWRNELKGAGLCYKAVTIKYEEFTKWEVNGKYFVKPDHKIELPENFIDSIQARQTLDDDYHTHNVINGKMPYIYNSRLWLGNVTEKLYGGMVCRDTTKGTRLAEWEAWTFIRKDGNLHVVYSVRDGWVSDNPRALFYPDPDAYRMVLHNNSVTSLWYDVDLTECDLLNASAWLNDFTLQDSLPLYDFDSIPDINKYPIVGGQPDTESEYDYTAITQYLRNLFNSQLNDNVYYPNKIYTSNVSNPFKFDSKTINSVGDGTVLALATVTEALSQGQFGQYPLYAFTTEGLWTLSISDTGAVSTIVPVSRDICINPDVVSIANAVVFLTHRGVMMVSGSQVIPLSAALVSETIPKLVISDEAKAIGMRPPVAIDIENITSSSLVYDYRNQRLLLFFDFDRERNVLPILVYSLIMKEWSTMTLSCKTSQTLFVKPKPINCYPDVYINTGGSWLYDVSSPVTSDRTDINIITQAMHVGSTADSLAMINQAIVRGAIRSGSGLKIAVYGSMDNINFIPLAASSRHFITRLRGSGWKSMIIHIFGTLLKDEAITGLSVLGSEHRTQMLK